MKCHRYHWRRKESGAKKLVQYLLINVTDGNLNFNSYVCSLSQDMGPQTVQGAICQKSRSTSENWVASWATINAYKTLLQN